MNIAFYAPIKPPDHPIPSGDRIIAGNLLKALEMAGFNTHLASRYICYSKRHAKEILEERKAGAAREAERLVAHYRALPVAEQPQMWVSYHPYCKAPDWVGSAVTAALGIPYVTVEAARTGQGGPEDLWRDWRAEAQATIRKADLHLWFKPTDRDYLQNLLGEVASMARIPNVIDVDGIGECAATPLPAEWDPKTPVIVTAGMMRKGKKDRNFYIMAELCHAVEDVPWNLVVVGGGPEAANIRKAFKPVDDGRIFWTGEVPHHDVAGWLKSADLFLWPGWKEPIGMVFLEAQLQGLPVIAMDSMGVPLVVEDGKTGLLSPEDDPGAMAENLKRLLGDRAMRVRFGKAARNKALQEHSLEALADALEQRLGQLGKPPNQP